MGGFGSGRYGFGTTKIDDGLRLDINKLKRDGQVDVGMLRSGRLNWARVSTGEHVASICYETDTLNPNDMSMRLRYTYTSPYEDEPEKRDYEVRLDTTQPHYGGQRLWFLCPITNRRTSVLYSPPGSKWFASRYAYNLKYQSQSKNIYDRALDRLWKLKSKVDEDDNRYLKPKGMHWKTFHKICNEIDSLEGITNQHLMAFISSKFGKYLDS